MWFFDKMTLSYIIGNEIKKGFVYLEVDLVEDNIIDNNTIDDLINFFWDYELFRSYKVWPKNAREISWIIAQERFNLINRNPKDFAYNVYRLHAILYHRHHPDLTKRTDSRVFENLYY